MRFSELIFPSIKLSVSKNIINKWIFYNKNPHQGENSNLVSVRLWNMSIASASLLPSLVWRRQWSDVHISLLHSSRKYSMAGLLIPVPIRSLIDPSWKYLKASLSIVYNKSLYSTPSWHRLLFCHKNLFFQW